MYWVLDKETHETIAITKFPHIAKVVLNQSSRFEVKFVKN